MKTHRPILDHHHDQVSQGIIQKTWNLFLSLTKPNILLPFLQKLIQGVTVDYFLIYRAEYLQGSVNLKISQGQTEHKQQQWEEKSDGL